MIVLGGEKFIVDILEEHFEILQVLWNQRLASIRSASMSPAKLRDLDERIAAHTDGLVLAGEFAFPILIEGLQAGDACAAVAAAVPLLLIETEPALQLVWQHFADAKGGVLDGIGLALCYTDILPVRKQLEEILESGSSLQASVAAEVLAYHRLLPRDESRWTEWLQSEDSEIRRRALRIAAILGSA